MCTKRNSELVVSEPVKISEGEWYCPEQWIKPPLRDVKDFKVKKRDYVMETKRKEAATRTLTSKTTTGKKDLSGARKGSDASKAQAKKAAGRTTTAKSTKKRAAGSLPPLEEEER